MYVPIEVTDDNIGWAINENIRLIQEEVLKRLQTQQGQMLGATLDTGGNQAKNAGHPTTGRSAVTVGKLARIHENAL